MSTLLTGVKTSSFTEGFYWQAHENNCWTITKRGRKSTFFSNCPQWFHALTFCISGFTAPQPSRLFSDGGRVLHNQHSTSIWLCERQRLVKDGYCFGGRRSVVEEGVKEQFKRQENERDEKLKATMKWSRVDLKNERKQRKGHGKKKKKNVLERKARRLRRMSQSEMEKLREWDWE